jgi:hypothetical protein
MFTDASDRRTFTDRRLVVGAVGGFDLKRDSGERGGWLVEKNWKISAVFLALVVLGGCGGVNGTAECWPDEPVITRGGDGRCFEGGQPGFYRQDRVWVYPR